MYVGMSEVSMYECLCVHVCVSVEVKHDLIRKVHMVCDSAFRLNNYLILCTMISEVSQVTITVY